MSLPLAIMPIGGFCVLGAVPMAEEKKRRKLTAIFSADVEGYSRLMADDEEATVITINAYRKVMTDLIQRHDGRVVDAKGDNVLAEFPSVVDAVRCSVEVQNELKTRNEQLPDHRKMEFRIGINLGDVIEEGDTIYGDGVNIAARIEKLAEPGGVSISGTVYDQVEGKPDLSFEYQGDQQMKNIPKPVRVYRVLMEPASLGEGLDRKPGSAEKMAFPLPDRPSIVVLPFVNMSGNPDQEFFSDGITEEIITGLSMVPYLFVIARNSSFIYKGKPVKVDQIGRELGVRYVLEGSVRRSGNRLRITAQLIEAATEGHLWAERYDRELKEIFALQDEITMRILTALQIKLTSGEQARVYGRGTNNLEAYIKSLEARKYFNKGDFLLARQMAMEAIELDDGFPTPYVIVAWTYWFDARFGWIQSREDSLKQSYSFAIKAQDLDDSLPEAYALLAGIHLYERQYEQAIAKGQKAISLGPNDAAVYGMMAHILRFSGKFEEAIAMNYKAMRLQPSYPTWLLMELAMCHYYLGRHNEAIRFTEQLRNLAESRGEAEIMLAYHLMLAMNYIRLGRDQEALAAASELLRLNPDFSLEWDRQYSCYQDPTHLELQHEDLRKAGLK
jgi:adenylate cyclase